MIYKNLKKNTYSQMKYQIKKNTSKLLWMLINLYQIISVYLSLRAIIILRSKYGILANNEMKNKLRITFIKLFT